MRAGLNGRAGFAEQERDRLGGLVGRLHAEHELEIPAARVVPGETAFRLEKHRIDGLGLEFAVQHQKAGIVRCEFRADLLAIGRGLGIGRRASSASGAQTGASDVLKAPGLTQPSWTGE